MSKFMNQVQLRHSQNSTHHWIDAFHPDFGGGRTPVGELSWSRKTGEVGLISVQPEHQRKGLGRRMMTEAGKYSPGAARSGIETEAGKKFFDKLGM